MIFFRTQMNEESVAKRIALILGQDNVMNRPEGHLPYRTEDKWVLEFRNNWWLYKGNDNEYCLRYRYENNDMLPVMEALQTFITWVLNPKS